MAIRLFILGALVGLSFFWLWRETVLARTYTDNEWLNAMAAAFFSVTLHILFHRALHGRSAVDWD